MELTQAEIDERAAILNEGYEGETSEKHTDEVVTDVEEVVAKEPETQEEQSAIAVQLAEIQEQVGGMAKIEERLRKSESRVGNLLQQIETLKSQKQPEAPSKEELEAAERDKEVIELFNDEYPGAVEALRKEFAPASNVTGDIEAVRGELQKNISAIPKEIEKRVVAVFHKNWEQDVQSPEFAAWAKIQDAPTQELINSDRANDVVTVLNRYKGVDEAVPQPKKEPTPAEIAADRKARRERQVDLNANGKPTKTKTFESMTPEEQRVYLVNEGYKEE